MADNTVASSAAQLMSTLKNENIQLQKQLAEVRHENRIIKKQLYQMSTLLDSAVHQLASKGITWRPFDINQLRAALALREMMDTSSDHNGTGDLSSENTATTQRSSNRRFQLRCELREHTKPIQCAAFAPGDQPLIATGGLDCRLILQNFFTGEKRLDIKGHENNVSNLAWFEGSGNILTASYDSTVKVWDPRHIGSVATSMYQFNATGFVLAAVPLDKSFVFACTDAKNRTSIVDQRVQKPVSWKHEVRANTLAFNSARTQLVTGHSNGTIAVWDVRKIGVALSSNSSLEGEITTNNNNNNNIPASSFTSSTLDDASSSSLPIPNISTIENEPSKSDITYMGYYHNSDDTRRLVVVSTDNMVRLYRETGLNNSSGDIFTLRNVVAGVPTSRCTVKAAFWKGIKEKSNVSAFFDDGERENDARPRRLTECDLMVTSGAENTACIYDVTEEGNSILVEKLEGHRDRVVGAAVHHGDSKPIIATYSVDNTVKVWVPVKS